MNDLRSKCRHRIDLGKDRAFRRLQRGKSANDEATRPTSPTGSQRGGSGGRR
jgi:hypothetical protein